MSQFNVTTTGTVATVVIDDLHLSLVHPTTIDLKNDALEKFTWAEILESDDLQTAITAGEIVATDIDGNTLSAVTLDKLSKAIMDAVAGTVTDAIVDGVTTIAPSQNAVFDALALKLDASGVSAFAATLLDDATATDARLTLGLGTAATSNTGDFATAAQGALADSSIQSVFGRTTSAISAAASDYDDNQIDLTYTPANFTATNAFVDGAIEGIDNALGALVGDGNETPIVRGDAVAGVAPTVGEVASPESGDTASVFLTDGQLEKWVYTGSWSLAFTLAANEATNLGYTASPTNGIVTSSTGNDVTLPAATGTNAGLLLPADFTKLGFISVTQAVDFDAIDAQQGDLVALSGVAANSTDLGTFTGTTIADNSTIKGSLQALETAVEAITGTTNLAIGTVNATGVEITSSTGTNATIPLATASLAGLYIPADKTKVDFITVTGAINLDTVQAQQNALVTLSGVSASATDLGTFTGGTISDNATVKAALQELETAIEAGSDDQTAAEVSIADAGGLYTGTDVETALQEVGQDAADLRTLSGTADGATDMGTYTGAIISDNQTTKQNIQELETALEARVYGTNFNLFQDLAVSTTTSTTFQSKISGTTSALEAGDYKITISYEWNHNAVNNDFEARFLFDGNAVSEDAAGLIHKQEPKDAAGNNPTGTGSSQRNAFTMSYYVTGVTAGTKSVALDYRTDNAGVASSVWSASIEIIRVA